MLLSLERIGGVTVSINVSFDLEKETESFEVCVRHHFKCRKVTFDNFPEAIKAYHASVMTARMTEQELLKQVEDQNDTL